VGCIGTTPMLPASAGCPAALPAAGDFTFFVASYATIGTSNSNPGNVIECRRNTASRQCRSALPVRPYSSAVPSGCLTNLEVTINGVKTTPNDCPPNGYMASRGFTFPLWQPATPGVNGDASAKLEACITPPIASGVRSCQGVVPANTWTSDVSNDTLATLTPSPAYLLGCSRPEAACPTFDNGKTPTYPLINAALKITACRTNSGPLGATECSAQQYLPLCIGATVNNAPTLIDTDGTCDIARTRGCILSAGATSYTTCYTRQQNGYPTVEGYSNFVMMLRGNAPVQSTVRACYETLSSATCGPGGVASAAGVYTVRVTSQGVFRGCTDTAANTCTAWWPAQPGVAGGVCLQQ
jgi:hypothetical protein